MINRKVKPEKKLIFKRLKKKIDRECRDSFHNKFNLYLKNYELYNSLNIFKTKIKKTLKTFQLKKLKRFKYSNNIKVIDLRLIEQIVKSNKLKIIKNYKTLLKSRIYKYILHNLLYLRRLTRYRVRQIKYKHKNYKIYLNKFLQHYYYNKLLSEILLKKRNFKIKLILKKNKISNHPHKVIKRKKINKKKKKNNQIKKENLYNDLNNLLTLKNRLKQKQNYIFYKNQLISAQIKKVGPTFPTKVKSNNREKQ